MKLIKNFDELLYNRRFIAIGDDFIVKDKYCSVLCSYFWWRLSDHYLRCCECKSLLAYNKMLSKINEQCQLIWHLYHILPLLPNIEDYYNITLNSDDYSDLFVADIISRSDNPEKCLAFLLCLLDYIDFFRGGYFK